MKRLIEQEQKSIKDIWDKTQYIPIYQREFVWEDEQIQTAVKTIFDDMKSSIESYMGNILIVDHESNNNKGNEIVDGQQRTTFAFLFIKSIYELLDEMKERIPEEESNFDFIEQINEKLSAIKELIIVPREERYDKEHMARIRYASDKLNQLIDSTLEGIKIGAKKNKKFRIVKMQEKIKALVISSILDPDNPSMKLTKIEGDVDEIKSISKKLFKLLEYFSEDVKYIEIKLKEEKYATEIFERMNSTSKPLTDYELFKNFIAGQLIGEDTSNVENKIIELDDMVNDEIYRLDAKTVINSILYLKEGRINKSKYKFNRIKEIYSKVTANSMYNEVKDLIANYQALEKLSLQKGESSSYLPYLIIKTYNLQQLKPAFVALTLQYGHCEEIGKLFMIIISVVFKRVVLGGEVANIIESLLFKTFSENGKLKNPQKIINDLQNEKTIIDTKEMKIEQSFFNKIVKNEFVKVLWIYAINSTIGNVNSLVSDANSEFSINFDKIQIEHILPRSWEEHWKDVVGDLDNFERDDLIDNPGNKMPILGTYNIQASNKSFEQKKKEHYSMSSLNNISKDDYDSQDKWVVTELPSMALDIIENAKTWNKKEILERAKVLKEAFEEEIEKYLNEK